MQGKAMRIAKVMNIIVAAVLFFTGIISVRAQTSPEQSIAIGSIRLTLGMPQDAAITALAGQYTVSQIGDSGEWELSTKDGTSIGWVDFNNNQLIGVTKEWLPEDQTSAFDAASRIYSALNDITNNSPTTCIVETGNEDQSGKEKRSVTITCGEKDVEISATKTERQRSIELFTTLMRRK
jgi:hypothetical protein